MCYFCRYKALLRTPAMVAKRSVFSQLQQRHHVPRAGPHFAFSPTSYGVTIGPDATGDLRPRKFGLFLELRQASWEVVGENVGLSPVLFTLSRHRAGPSKACVGPLSLRERPGRAATALHTGPGRFRRHLSAPREWERPGPGGANPRSGHPCVRAFRSGRVPRRRRPSRSAQGVPPVHRGYGEGSSAVISSQLDFSPSPSEFTAATR